MASRTEDFQSQFIIYQPMNAKDGISVDEYDDSQRAVRWWNRGHQNVIKQEHCEKAVSHLKSEPA
ncbi:uncharacterized protein N7529_010242 [Penicillium soppii]|uniref:uncharacterized protein n=1 Tax=Penicillium soppii TaxID=69789 RepID=UPI0025492E2F|nr:uncharacterized protein N7529_010242 [Penicillium soppii]KAJ5856298.1 hypothetical protein N7529_010242 [Penicillium soppii]